MKQLGAGKERERILVRYARLDRLHEKETLLRELTSAQGKPEALEGIQVLDLSYANFAGIVTASLFGAFGADVVKVEPPEGDPARKMTPFGVTRAGVGVPFLMEAANKRHVTVDWDTQEGRELLKKLASKADVLIETFARGQMDSWGLGYRQLRDMNPGIIYICITPHGHYAPSAEEMPSPPDSDITAQAASGLAALIGEPPGSPQPYDQPLKAGAWIAWYISGIHAALGGLLALIFRQVSGKGQMVDVASYDSYATCVGYPVVTGYTWEKARPRIGVLDFILYPYGHWKTKDGHVVIAAPRDHDFRAALKVLDLWRIEDDWRYTYDRIPDIIDQAMVLYREIEKQTLKHTSQELMNRALEYSTKAAKSKWRGGGVPIIMPVQTPASALQNPHWRARHTFEDVSDPEVGTFVIPFNFVKMSETPPRVKRFSWKPQPAINETTNT